MDEDEPVASVEDLRVSAPVLGRCIQAIQSRSGSAAAERRDREVEFGKLLAKVGRRYAKASFRAYVAANDRQRAVLAALQAYAERWPENRAQGAGIVLYGPRGTGKDHLAVATAGRILAQFSEVLEWVDGQELYALMRDRIGSELSELEPVKRLTAASVLIISDPLPQDEAKPLTDYQQSVLWRVIDRRYRDLRPTWVTLNVADFNEASRRLGPQIADRLSDGALALHCDWPSYRKPAAVVK